MALRFPPTFLKSYSNQINGLLINGGISKSKIKKILKEDTFKRQIERNLKRDKRIKQFPEIYQFGEIEDFFYNLLNENHFQVNKQKQILEFDSEKTKDKSTVLANSIANTISNKIEDDIYKLNGLSYWVWTPSSNKNTNKQHELYYGLVSKVGETPDKNGDIPQLLPYCQCGRKYLTYKEAKKLGYNSKDKRFKAKLR